MAKKDYASLIKKVASRYNLIPSWLEAIVQNESNWNAMAIRYEPTYAWVYEVDHCARMSKVSLATELATQKISWGLAQVMGALGREQGLKGSILQLLDPETNLNHLALRIKYLRRISSNKDDIFAMYNGGPAAYKKGFGGLYTNQNYVDHINLILKELDESQ